MTRIAALALGATLVAQATPGSPQTPAPPAGQAAPAGAPQAGDAQANRAQAPADWRTRLEAYAVTKLDHPAWGVSHARRNYKLTLELARAEGARVDADALLAASWLHDMGAIEGFSRPGVEHMARALELLDERLLDAGFPMEKAPLVRAIVGRHMYSSDASGQPPEAVLFRDADTLDFLGAIGVVRIFALTGRHRWATDADVAEATLRRHAAELPARLSSASARRIGAERVREMAAFLDALAAEK